MYWIIGDIHGMARPLEALLAAVLRRDPAAHLIFVGDYVNRGIESRQVIDLLLNVKDATFLRGNHDDILDLLLHGTCFICHPSAPDRLSAFVWFIQHGLAETLMSYGADWAELDWIGRKPNQRAVEQCLAIVPDNHRKFIRSLKPYFETPDFVVIHGYWDPDESDDSAQIATRVESDPQLRYRMLWWRFTEEQITRKKKWNRRGYFGHTPVFHYRGAGTDFVPIRGEKIVLLDTAVALCPAGNLSAVCAESGTVLQSNRGGEIIELQ